VIVCFVDIGGINYHHCLNFLLIICVLYLSIDMKTFWNRRYVSARKSSIWIAYSKL